MSKNYISSKVAFININGQSLASISYFLSLLITIKVADVDVRTQALLQSSVISDHFVNYFATTIYQFCFLLYTIKVHYSCQFLYIRTQVLQSSVISDHSVNDVTTTIPPTTKTSCAPKYPLLRCEHKMAHIILSACRIVVK